MEINYNQLLTQNEAMMDALRGSSVSDMDARMRANEYAKMFSRNDDMKNLFGAKSDLQVMQRLLC